MPAYGFKSQFVEMVVDGRKTTTIRQERKDGRKPRAGQTAHCYFGMRTKVCRLLRRSPITSVDDIWLQASGPARLKVRVSGRVLTAAETEALARADGFPSAMHLRAFFAGQYGLPFGGLLIAWDPNERREA